MLKTPGRLILSIKLTVCQVWDYLLSPPTGEPAVFAIWRQSDNKRIVGLTQEYCQAFVRGKITEAELAFHDMLRPDSSSKEKQRK